MVVCSGCIRMCGCIGFICVDAETQIKSGGLAGELWKPNKLF